MASLFNKALLYLGLVDEDSGGQVDDLADPTEAPPRPVRQASSSNDRRQEEQVSRVEGRRVEPPPAASRSSSYRTEAADQSAPVRPIRSLEAQSDILLVEEFGDARMLADRVRDRVPVVLDLRQAQPDLVRRVIDFSSGLIYALDGTMTKVSEGVVLVLPPRVMLSQAEKRRLSRLGVYELVEED